MMIRSFETVIEFSNMLCKAVEYLDQWEGAIEVSIYLQDWMRWQEGIVQ